MKTLRTLSTEELLSKFAYKYHEQLLVVICTICHFAVRSGDLGKHACKHGGFKDSSQFNCIMKGVARRFAIDDNATLKTGVRYGDIEHVDAFECSDCQRVFPGIPSAQKHISEHETNATFDKIKARKLFKNDQLTRFDEESESRSRNKVGVAVKASLPASVLGSLDVSARVVSPFLNASGWLSLLQDLDEDTAKSTVCLMTAGRSDRFVRLKSACRDLVDDINSMVRNAAYPILELMTPENHHDKQSHNFRALQEQSSVHSYSLRLTRLIEFMVLTADAMGSLEYELTDEQKHLRDEVKQEFEDGHCPSGKATLIALATSIFTCIPSYIPRERNQYLLVYMVMESITEELEFKAQNSVSCMVAELQWLCRAFIFRKAVMGAASLIEQQTAVLNVRELLMEQRFTPFNCIRSTMRQVASSGPTAMFENAIWLDESKRALAVGDKELELDNLRHGVKKMIEDLHQALKTLMNGADCDGLYPELGGIRDNLQNGSPGYSFLSDPRNLQSKETIGAWAGLPSVCKLLMSSDNDFGKMVNQRWNWDTTYLEAWLESAKKFLELLACVVHLTGGGPPRAEEAVTFAIKNCNGKMRNLCIHGKHAVFVGQYHKSQNINGRFKLLARVLPESVSKILIQYLYLVRPMEIMLLRVLGEKTANAEAFFYSSRNKVWSGEQYRIRFSRTIDMFLNEGLGIQEWRHASVAIRRDHGINCPEESGELFGDLQTGHVGATAHAYGRTESYFTTMTSSECLGYFRSSKAWHVFLGLAAGSLVKGSESSGEVVIRKNEIIYHHVWRPQQQRSSGNLIVNAQIIEALIRMTGNAKARLRPNQVQPILATLQRQDNLLVVMPTGGGKTLVYMLPAMLEENKVTVVITPLMYWFFWI